MNKNFRVLYILFLLFFSFNLKPENAAVCTTPKEQNKVDLVGTSLRDSLENIKNLDYYTSKDLSIYLPNDYKIVIDWGFTGSGDIFSEYPEIKISYIENIQDPKAKKEFSLLKLTEVLVKAEINKQLKYNYKNISQELKEHLPQFAWLSNLLYDPSNSAIKMFSLKLFLLLKNYATKQDETEFKTELLKLLVRLAQGNVKNLVDKNLSNLLPKEILEYIKQDKNLSNMISFIDSFWANLSRSFKEYKFDQNGAYDKSAVGLEATGFVFQNSEIAKKVFNSLDKNNNILSKEQFIRELQDLSKIYKFEIINIKDFDKYKDLKNYNFAGQADFGRINAKSNNPEFIKTKVLESKELPKILLTEQDNKSYIVFATDKLDLVETLKLIFVAFTKTFKEFKDIQKIKKQENKQITSKQDNLTLVSLNRSLEDLKIKMTLLLAQEDILKKDIAKWKNALKNKLSEVILRDLEEKYQQILAQKEVCLNEVKSIQKHIQALQTTDTNEFKALVKAFNSEDPDYLKLKENLFNQLRFILKNSEHVQDNLQVYNYLIGSLYPDLIQSYKLLDNSVLA